MANGEYTRTLTIESMKRLNLSAMGNPRFEVTFTDGSVAQTQTNSSVGYSIENPEYRGVPVLVSFTRAGKIFGVDVADKH